MGQPATQNIPPELTAARRRVDEWRDAQKGTRRLIPEKIWAEAVELTRKHSAYRVSEALGLPYESLSKKVGTKSAAGRRAKRRPKLSKPDFVELPVVASETSTTTIELRGSDGVSLLVRTSTAQVAEVVAAVWKVIA